MKTLKELEQIREQTLKNLQLRNQEHSKLRVVVGMGTCGISAGARSVLNTLIQEVNNCHLEEVMITQTGCVGMCAYELILLNKRRGIHVILSFTRLDLWGNGLYIF